MLNFCTGISTHFPILAFQGSMNLGSRLKGFLACIEHLGTQERLVLGGRSMGARAAVMAATEVLEEDEARQVELVLASYPLQGPKDVRDQILLDLPASVRVVFVSGDRDVMCPLEMLEGVRKRMKARSRVVVVKGADHGMHVKPARLEREVGERTGRVVADWLAGEVEDDVTYIEVEE
jgi:predicted alpha/beta-hydrolase family hydrolase